MRKLIYIKGKIWGLAKLRVMRNIEWTNSSKIANFCSQILVFRIEKIIEIGKFFNSKNSENLHFRKFEKFAIWKIRKIANLKSSENFSLGKFRKLSIGKFEKLSIWKILKNIQFGKFQKCSIGKIRKICNFEIPKIANLENSKNI